MYSARGFITAFSKRETGFYRQAKRFELNFTIRKNFPLDDQTRQGNHPHSHSICPVPGPNEPTETPAVHTVQTHTVRGTNSKSSCQNPTSR